MEAPAGQITAAITAARASLCGVAGSPAWSLRAEELTSDLVALHELAGQVAELELRLVAQADHDDLAGAAGDVSTGVWWARATRQLWPVAKRRARLALALDSERRATAEAMTRGHVTEAQAGVIADAIDALPADELDAETIVQAEKLLVHHAADLDPRALKIVGDRLLETIAPDVAEEYERRAVETEEARAEAKTRFTLHHDPHGTTTIRATIPALQGAMLEQMVQACWNPDHGAGPHARGLAFVEMIERVPTDRLPEHGGVAATLTIGLDLDDLTTSLDPAGVVRLDGGLRISAGTARRLACEAGLIPIVLGRRSAVLDVGRSARLHTRPQRIAIGRRDRTCTAEGCDYPPGLCHVHHDDPWKSGGKTSVDNGRLLCPKHHRMIHSGNYQITPAKNGRLLFRRT